MRYFRCSLIIGALTLIASSAGQAQTAAAPVKIGVMGDGSGTYADFSGKGAVEAAKMAIEDFGKTVLARPIEIISADHQNKPDIAASLARKWFDNEGVDVITDLTNSAVAIAVQDIAKEKKKITLVTSTTTTALTNKNCSPWGVHWSFDAYALTAGTVQAMMEEGGKSWFFFTADYTFGHNMEANAAKLIKAAGGKIIGRALFPLGNTDYSSHLLQAQASGANFIGLATAGADTANAVKQANEYGITKKQKIASLLVFITDVHSMGLKNAQGLTLTTSFYWDRTEETRAWSQRFFKRHGAMPTQVHAGTYSAVMHYLNAVKAVGTKDTEKVMARMRATPINDFFAKNGRIREDGRMVHDMYLAQVKSPAESKQPWDYYKILRTIPGDKAFQPLAESECPLVKK